MKLLLCGQCGFVMRLSLDGCACNCPHRTRGWLAPSYEPVIGGDRAVLLEIDENDLARALSEFKQGQREPIRAWVLSQAIGQTGEEKR